MRLRRPTLGCFTLPILLTSIALAAPPQGKSANGAKVTDAITSATATVLNVDLAHGTATVEIVNKSDKDITAYSLAIKLVLQKHRVINSERMMDYGSLLAAKGEVLHPGQTSTQLLVFRPGEVVAVDATVVALVFADRTSEVSDPEALSRISDHRESMLLMTQISVEAIKHALATTTNHHPTALAGSIIRDSSSAGIAKEYMNTLAKELEDGANRAASDEATEREYLAQRLADLQQQARQEQAYAKITRQP